LNLKKKDKGGIKKETQTLPEELSRVTVAHFSMPGMTKHFSSSISQHLLLASQVVINLKLI
jgi:hypothetical protein